MRKFIKPLGILFFLLMIASTPLLAQETTLDETKAKLYLWSLIIGGAVIAIASSAGAYCQAKALSSACEGISRNPGSGPHIRFLLIFGLVLIETLVIYALLVSIFIIMVKWGAYN